MKKDGYSTYHSILKRQILLANTKQYIQMI